MSELKNLVLLRHGKTDYLNRYIGSRDVPLSTEGIAQIKALQERLQSEHFDKIIVSPMLRCRQTCEILFPDGEIHIDDDLREIDFGLWEGLSFQEIVERDPEHVERWANWSLDFCFPEGEAIGHFVSRVKDAGTRLAELPQKKILIVSHGGVLRALLCQFLGLAPENYLLFQVEKGTFSTLSLHGELGVLTGFNLH